MILASAEAMDFRRPSPSSGIFQAMRMFARRPNGVVELRSLWSSAALDDFDRDATDLLQLPFQFVAGIATVGENMQQPWPSVTNGIQWVRHCGPGYRRCEP